MPSSLLAAGFLLLDGGMIFAPDVRKVNRRRWKREFELLHRVGDDLRDGEIAEPLVIRRDHVPGRVRRAGRVDRVLERLDVVVPKLAL